MAVQHRQSGDSNDPRQGDAGSDQLRHAKLPKHVDPLEEEKLLRARNRTEPPPPQPLTPQDQAWADAPLGVFRRLLSEHANDWFALFPINSSGVADFESALDPREILPGNERRSWDTFENILCYTVTTSFSTFGLLVDEPFQKMQRRGYRPVVAVGLTFLEELKRRSNATSLFENACSDSIDRLLKTISETVDSNQALPSPLPDNAVVAFWDRLAIWTKTPDQIAADLPGEQRIRLVAEVLPLLSDDDRFRFVQQLVPHHTENDPTHFRVSVPDVIDALSRFNRYASAIRNVALPEFARMLDLLANVESSDDEEVTSDDEKARLAKEKATLVDAIQDTVASLDAELTYRGQPCNIYFLTPEKGYPSGGYRVRLRGKKGDVTTKRSFPSDMSVRPRDAS